MVCVRSESESGNAVVVALTMEDGSVPCVICGHQVWVRPSSWGLTVEPDELEGKTFVLHSGSCYMRPEDVAAILMVKATPHVVEARVVALP
jgi:hypothetical protein